MRRDVENLGLLNAADRADQRAAGVAPEAQNDAGRATQIAAQGAAEASGSKVEPAYDSRERRDLDAAERREAGFSESAVAGMRGADMNSAKPHREAAKARQRGPKARKSRSMGARSKQNQLGR